MKVFITSTFRIDLLEKTIESLLENQRHEISEIVIHEDYPEITLEMFSQMDQLKKIFAEKVKISIDYTSGIGQHASIEKFLSTCDDEFVLFCEDDWVFDNSYDWIGASIDILKYNKKIAKVLCRIDSPHPCEHDMFFIKYTYEITFSSPLEMDWRYGILQPWFNNNILWAGFSFNPGVTRVEALKNEVPFGKYEQDVAWGLFLDGWKIAELSPGVYKHIGEGRSTHA